ARAQERPAAQQARPRREETRAAQDGARRSAREARRANAKARRGECEVGGEQNIARAGEGRSRRRRRADRGSRSPRRLNRRGAALIGLWSPRMRVNRMTRIPCRKALTRFADIAPYLDGTGKGRDLWRTSDCTDALKFRGWRHLAAPRERIGHGPGPR